MSAFEEARVIGKCIHCGVGVYILPMIELVVGKCFRIVNIEVHVKGHERCQGPQGYLSTVAEVRQFKVIGKEETA